MNYLDQLFNFHHSRGSKIAKLPFLDKRPVDLYLLKVEVENRGGYREVTEQKKWAEVGRALGYINSKLATSLSTALRQIYSKYNLPYEDYLVTAKPEVHRTLGLTPSPPTESQAKFPKAEMNCDANISEDEEQDPDFSDDRDVHRIVMSIIKRACTDELEPDGSRKRKRDSDEIPTIRGSNMGPHNSPRESPVNLRPRRSTRIPRDAGLLKCEVCSGVDEEVKMVSCESCSTSYHIQCTSPPLKRVPKRDWFCNRCLVGTGEFGFEDGGEYSIPKFRDKADQFKRKMFSSYFESHPEMRTSTSHEVENIVEKEFWKLVSDVDRTVTVEYGADIHSTTHGSGFPTIEKFPLSPYSVNSWNLNNIAYAPGSLFRYIKADISGMTNPWLYVGMCFSTFCWHAEDHYAYSINYQHVGDTKTWYGVPGRDADKLEAAMKKLVPDLFETQPDLLFQLVTMFSPEKLRNEGVDVFAVDQRPNQFVVTFPEAYHAGFNHGFNVNEAVNFALPDWESYGRDCVNTYQKFCKNPVFSHDELLFAIIKNENSVMTAQWLRKPLAKMVSDEIDRRKKFKLNFPKCEIENAEELDENNADEDQCYHCRAYVYMSKIICSCSQNVSCFEHADGICDNPECKLALVIRFSNEELKNLSNTISIRADAPRAWKEKMYSSLADVEMPSLRGLRALLNEGERINHPIKEVTELKDFIAAAAVLVDEANFFVKKHRDRKRTEKCVEGCAQQDENDKNKEPTNRDLGYLWSIIKKAERMGFESPEFGMLQEKIAEIEDFQQRAREAVAVTTAAELDSAAMYEDLIDDLIEEGKAFNVELQELDDLEKRAEFLAINGFKKRAIEALNRQASTANDRIVEYEELIREGKEFSVNLQEVGELEKYVRYLKMTDMVKPSRESIGPVSVNETYQNNNTVWRDNRGWMW